MKIKGYSFDNKQLFVTLTLVDNLPVIIFFNEMSGKIICRGKIDSLLKIKHTGIYIGKDINGDDWVVHNHYLNKMPKLDLFNVFAKGKPVEEYKIIVATNSPLQIIEESLKAIIEGKNYSILNNCQHLVSKAATGKSFSKDLQRATLTIAFAGGLAAVSSKNKFLRIVGLLTLISGLSVAIYDSSKR